MKTIQENMGHYSQAFSMDTYGHVVARMRQRGADKLDYYVLKLKEGPIADDTGNDA